MDQFLLKYLCGFGKGFTAQECLLAMLENWKIKIDEGNVFGVLLIDLPNA